MPSKPTVLEPALPPLLTRLKDFERENFIAMDTSVNSNKEEYLVTSPIGLTSKGSAAAPYKKANLASLSKSPVPIISSTTTHTKAAQLVPLFHRCSYIPVPQSLHPFLLPSRPITVADYISTRAHYASFLPKIPQLDFRPLLWMLFTETPAAHKTLIDTALHHEVWLWVFILRLNLLAARGTYISITPKLSVPTRTFVLI
jgi:hypothetical protein